MTLKAEEAQLLGALAFPVIASDGEGNIEFFNREAEQLLGWSMREVRGNPIAMIMPERMRDRHRAGIARYLRTHESRLLGKPVRVPAQRRDGTEVDVDLQLRLFKRPDGTDLIVASLSRAGATRPEGLIELETKLQKRAYQLV